MQQQDQLPGHSVPGLNRSDEGTSAYDVHADSTV